MGTTLQAHPFRGLTVLSSEGSDAMTLTLDKDSYIKDLSFEGPGFQDHAGILLSGPKSYLYYQDRFFQWPPEGGAWNVDLSTGLPAGTYNAYVLASRPTTFSMTMAGLDGSATYDMNPWSGHAGMMRNLGEHRGIPKDVEFHTPVSSTPFHAGIPQPPFQAATWETFNFSSPAAIMVMEWQGSSLWGVPSPILFARVSVVNLDTGEVQCSPTTMPWGGLGGASWKVSAFLVGPGRWEARLDALGAGNWYEKGYVFAVPLLDGDVHGGYWTGGNFSNGIPSESWSSALRNLPVPWADVHGLLPERSVKAAADDVYCTPRPSL